MAKTKTTYRSSNYKFGLNGDLDMNMSMAKSMFPGFFNAQVMMPEIADVLILGLPQSGKTTVRNHLFMNLRGSRIDAKYIRASVLETFGILLKTIVSFTKDINVVIPITFIYSSKVFEKLVSEQCSITPELVDIMRVVYNDPSVQKMLQRPDCAVPDGLQ